MNNSNSIQYQNLSHRVQVLEKAVKEVLEMNTILHLEINMLKKKVTDQNGTSSTSSSDNGENKNSTQQADVDNAQLQQIMAMRKAQMAQQQMQSNSGMGAGRSINISRN
jgi:regulator of replication initiation timing